MHKKIEKEIEAIRLRLLIRMDGGSGSGNWGHSGVEGQRGGSAPNSSSSSGFSTNYSKKRIKNAFSTMDKQKAHDSLLPSSKEFYHSLTQEEKNAINNYTSNSRYANRYARNGESAFEGMSDENRDYHKSIYDGVNSALEKGSIDRDIVVGRGINKNDLEKMFGIEEGSINKDNISCLVGMQGTEDGFLSTSAAIGQTGGGPSMFAWKEVQMKIFVPKGTKGAYIDPMSAFGGNKSSFSDVSTGTWDDEHVKTPGGETEILLQRGTSIAINSISDDGRKIQVNASVIGQKSY